MEGLPQGGKPRRAGTGSGPRHSTIGPRSCPTAADIWGGTTTAERDFEGEGLSPHSINRTFYLQFGAVRNFTIATYRVTARAGQRAHEHKALIAAPPDEARAVLEALTGPLRDFEVIEVVEQAITAPNPAPLPDISVITPPERATQPRNVVSLPNTRQDAERPPQRPVRAGAGGGFPYDGYISPLGNLEKQSKGINP